MALPRPRFATLLALILAAAALLAWGSVRGSLPSGWAATCALPLWLGGAALPLLLRWTPVEPSAIKLGLLSCLLSPPLLAALRFAAGSWSTALLIVAGLQLLALGRVVRFERPGRAGWIALALAAGTAAGLAWLLLGQGWAPRLDRDAQVWHAAVAEMLLRGGALENPFLAGTPLPTHPGYAALLATLAQSLSLPVATAAGLVTVWAVATLPVSLYLVAGPLWGRALPVVAAPVFALVLWSGSCALGLVGEEVLGRIALEDPLLLLGPEAPALALAAGALLAAVHALRHGRRPWVGLVGVLAGASFLLSAPIGACALAAPALAALVAPGVAAVRTSVPLAVLAGALPGLWLARRFGVEALPLGEFHGRAALVFVWPLLALDAIGGWASSPARGSERRTLVVLLILFASLPIIAAAWLPVHAAGLSRLAALGLAPLAAGCLLAAGQARGARHLLTALAAGVVLLGLSDLATRAPLHLKQARLPLKVAAREGGVEAQFLTEQELPGTGLLNRKVVLPAQFKLRAQEVRRRHRALAYRWVRDNSATLGPRPVFWRSLGGVGDRSRGALALHLAPLYSGLPLWCDDAQEIAAESPRWSPRRERVSSLYQGPDSYDANTLRELQELGRAAVFLVEEADRDATYRGEYLPFRGVDLELERLGAERAFSIGTVAVYTWRPREEIQP